MTASQKHELRRNRHGITIFYRFLRDRYRALEMPEAKRVLEESYRHFMNVIHERENAMGEKVMGEERGEEKG